MTYRVVTAALGPYNTVTVTKVGGVEMINAVSEVLFLYGAERWAGGARKVLFAVGAHNLLALEPVDEPAES